MVDRECQVSSAKSSAGAAATLQTPDIWLFDTPCTAQTRIGIRLNRQRVTTIKPHSAGNMPESVRTRYDLLGICVHGRLQYAY